MGKKYKNLFREIVSRENVLAAYEKTSRGKKSTRADLEFQQNFEVNINNLIKRMKDPNFKPCKTHTFVIKDPKPRVITALAYEDRIIQHAIFSVVNPIFDKVFLPQSYACRTNKGTHRASRDLQATLRRSKEPYTVVKTDFSKYFHSIRRRVLHKELTRKISCNPTLRLISAFVPLIGVGINIGELLSQLLANVYGHIFDRFIVHKLRITKFFRYMDDIILLTTYNKTAKLLLNMIRNAAHGIKLNLSKWSISSSNRPIDFVGYRIHASYKLIRKSSMQRAKRKLKTLTGIELERFISSWYGHTSHANSYNLRKKLGLTK